MRTTGMIIALATVLGIPSVAWSQDMIEGNQIDQGFCETTYATPGVASIECMYPENPLFAEDFDAFVSEHLFRMKSLGDRVQCTFYQIEGITTGICLAGIQIIEDNVPDKI